MSLSKPVLPDSNEISLTDPTAPLQKGLVSKAHIFAYVRIWQPYLHGFKYFREWRSHFSAVQTKNGLSSLEMTLYHGFDEFDLFRPLLGDASQAHWNVRCVQDPLSTMASELEDAFRQGTADDHFYILADVPKANPGQSLSTTMLELMENKRTIVNIGSYSGPAYIPDFKNIYQLMTDLVVTPPPPVLDEIIADMPLEDSMPFPMAILIPLMDGRIPTRHGYVDLDSLFLPANTYLLRPLKILFSIIAELAGSNIITTYAINDFFLDAKGITGRRIYTPDIIFNFGFRAGLFDMEYVNNRDVFVASTRFHEFVPVLVKEGGKLGVIQLAATGGIALAPAQPPAGAGSQ